MDLRQTSPRFAVEVALIAVFAVVIWLPESAHYWTRTPALAPTDIAAARLAPADAKLAEISALSVALPPCGAEDSLAAAEAILRGEFPHFPGVHIGMPFRDADLDGPGEAVALSIASLTPVDLLVSAYERSRDPRFMDAALAYVQRFDTFERGALRPRGFLWNDHALAARVGVLIRLWAQCRNDSCTEDRAARPVLAQLLRAAEFLARDSHYTVRTNHGVMQNLALLQISVAMPDFPDASRYREVAIARLNRHLAFYLSPDGFILEHSPGYQRFGVHLLRRIARLLELNQSPSPPRLATLARAEAVLEALRRPDGTLPLIGDTDRAPGDCALQTMERSGGQTPQPGSVLLPLAGYSVDWAGSGSEPIAQTVLAWSNFPGHGHKHADDLSLTLWRGGRDWLTGVGYWPYDLWGRPYSESWAATNAPHLVDEGASGARRNRLNSYAWSRDASLIDLSSVRAGGAQFNRQVVRIGTHLWLIVDFAKPGDAPRATSRTWTTAPGIGVEQRETGWIFRDPGRGEAMSLALVGSPMPRVLRTRGDRDPPGGWVVIDQVPMAADALRVTQDGVDAWLVSAFHFGNSSLPVAVSAKVDETTRWTAEVRSEDGTVAIDRQPGSLSIRRPGSAALVLALEPGKDVEAERNAIERALDAATAAFPKYRDLHAYRLRVSWTVAGAFLLYLLLLGGVRRKSERGWKIARATGTLCWLGAAAWLHAVYFHA